MENSAIKEFEAKISDMEEIIARFAELLTEENQALEQFDVATVGALYDQKAKIVSAYRTLTAFFIKHSEELAVVEAARREHLREVSAELNQLISKNEILLKTRMETSQNVMNTIINIAKVTNNINATSYGAQGRYTPLDNNKNALAVNRTL